MKKGLTKKEKDFAKEYAKTGNGVQSALKTYDTEDYSTAGVIAHDNLKKPKIQKEIKSIADQISDKELLKVHKEGLKASRKIFRNNMKTGAIEYVGSEPDHTTRHKYLDTAYKLKKLYDGDDSKAPQNITFNIVNYGTNI